ARRFLAQRAARIYPLYWVWCVPVLAVFLLRPDLVNSSHAPPDVVRSLLLLPQQNLPLLLVSWTLVYEMFFYLLFAGALRWVRGQHLPWVLTGWAAFVVAGNLALRPDEARPIANLAFSPLLLEFIAGSMIALCADRIGRRAAVLALAAGLAVFASAT